MSLRLFGCTKITTPEGRRLVFAREGGLFVELWGTDGRSSEERQEFPGYRGIILNLSVAERKRYWERFGGSGISTQEVAITDYREGDSEARVHTFDGHQAFSMTLSRLAGKWAVTEITATFRVY